MFVNVCTPMYVCICVYVPNTLMCVCVWCVCAVVCVFVSLLICVLTAVHTHWIYSSGAHQRQSRFRKARTPTGQLHQVQYQVEPTRQRKADSWRACQAWGWEQAIIQRKTSLDFSPYRFISNKSRKSSTMCFSVVRFSVCLHDRQPCQCHLGYYASVSSVARRVSIWAVWQFWACEHHRSSFQTCMLAWNEERKKGGGKGMEKNGEWEREKEQE